MTKLAGDHVQVLAGGYELTTVSQKINPGETMDQHDVTCFGDGVHNVINGQKMVTLSHAGLFDPDGAHAALELGTAEDVPLTVLVGENAAPAVGNIAFLMDNRTSQYQVTPDMSGAVPFSAEYAVKSARGGGWGKALAVPVTLTDTIDGAAVDNGAASSNGGVATLHVLTAPASDTYVVKVQHSADDVSYADLVTFTLDGAATGGEYQTVAAGTTVNRYLRYQATRTGSGQNFRLAVAFARL